jgi:hypothetical protein
MQTLLNSECIKSRILNSVKEQKTLFLKDQGAKGI